MIHAGAVISAISKMARMMNGDIMPATGIPKVTGMMERDVVPPAAPEMAGIVEDHVQVQMADQQ